MSVSSLDLSRSVCAEVLLWKLSLEVVVEAMCRVWLEDGGGQQSFVEMQASKARVQTFPGRGLFLWGPRAVSARHQFWQWWFTQLQSPEAQGLRAFFEGLFNSMLVLCPWGATSHSFHVRSQDRKCLDICFVICWGCQATLRGELLSCREYKNKPHSLCVPIRRCLPEQRRV